MITRNGDLYLQRLPGWKRIFRFRTDDAWLGALATALEWTADSGACTFEELHDGLRKILESYPDFSRFERRVIFSIATSEVEA
jgi:hypothetical protein